MLTVLHLITDLDVGGAETFLCRLAQAMDRDRFRSIVAAMNGDGRIADELRAAGIEVRSLEMARGTADPRGFFRLVRMLRRERPHLLQTWLYHADLLGLMAGKLSGVKRIAWNLRCSNMDLSRYAPRTARLRRVLAGLSRLPDAVLSNSVAGQQWHERVGYRPRRWQIIANGIDPERFKPDRRSRDRFRSSLGVDSEMPLIGVTARYDPMKGHDTFFRAAARIEGARFVLVGCGMVPENASLAQAIGANDGRIHLLGERADMPEIYAGLDIACLSSTFGEGFPNGVAEAMACGVPCVVTDVGDAARVVGDCGIVVPPSDPGALAEGLRRLLDLGTDDRHRLGQRARDRIAREFPLDASVSGYQDFYADLIGNGGRDRG